MNIVDALLALIILVAAWNGYRTGFIAGTTALLGWFGSIVVALLLYPYLAQFFESEVTSNATMAFILAFFVTIILVRILFSFLINALLQAVPRKAEAQPVNRFLGILPGALTGMIYAFLLAILLPLFPFKNRMAETVAQSILVSRMGKLAGTAEEALAPGLGDRLKRSLNTAYVETGTKDYIKLDFTVNNPVTRPDLEAQMLVLVNAERKKEGLKLLRHDPEMQAVARNHSKDMFARGYFSHYAPGKISPFDRFAKAKVSFQTAGENLALAPTLVTAHQGLMKSPGHRANILHPSFGRLGIGILDGGRRGLMVTQNFRN